MTLLNGFHELSLSFSLLHTPRGGRLQASHWRTLQSFFIKSIQDFSQSNLFFGFFFFFGGCVFGRGTRVARLVSTFPVLLQLMAGL